VPGKVKSGAKSPTSTDCVVVMVYPTSCISDSEISKFA